MPSTLVACRGLHYVAQFVNTMVRESSRKASLHPLGVKCDASTTDRVRAEFNMLR